MPLSLSGLRAAIFPIFLAQLALSGISAQSRWVHPGPDGKLVYLQTHEGDRIADYSSAGYRGGGVALPVVPGKRTVAPSAGDDTAAIQKAIDEVSALPLENGFRGAVELAAGVFHCSGTLSITASGVVLRGAGNGGTTLQMTGDPHLALRIEGHLEQKQTAVQTEVADDYVPSGTRILHLTDAAQLHPGDVVEIDKPVTPSWIHFMLMDSLNREGRDEHWIGKDHLEVRRRISAIQGNAIQLNIPLMDNYDAKFFDGHPVAVHKVEVSGQLAGVGVENLRIVAPQRSIDLSDPHFDGLSMKDAVDSWLQSVNLEETPTPYGLSREPSASPCCAAM